MSYINILEEFIQGLTKEIDFAKEELFSGRLDYERYKYVCGYINGLDKAYLILAEINKRARDNDD